MQISRRAFAFSAISVSALPFHTRAQAQISLATAINRAARLRALSQRCTKLFAQLVLQVTPENAANTLVSAQRLIQTSVDDLRRAALRGEAATLYAATTSLAANLIADLASKPDKDSMIKINATADRLLVQANKLTAQLSADSKQNSSRIIDIAGRQRMLSQRLAKNYFLQAAGITNVSVRSEITQDLKDYREAAQTLANAPLATPAIRNDQQLAQMQWTLFEAAIARKSDLEGMRTVATTSERLLEVNNNLTELYEVALRDLLGNTN